jgi:EamA domain-containing membrane protein RarD
VATIAALVIAGSRGRIMWRTACLGAAAGTSFGLTATMIKETIAQGEDRGLVGVLTTWQTYTAVGFGIFGLVIMQWALHTGPLLAAQPGFTLMDPLVSILWGTLVFNEVTRTGGWLVPATLGAVAVGVGIVVLARSPLMADTVDLERPIAGTNGAYRA